MENEKPKLKPCPFCGGEPNLTEDDKSNGVYYVVECVSCAAQGPWSKTASGAISTWNNRTDSVKEQLAEALGCIAAISEKYLLSGCSGGTMVDICSKAAWPLAAYREEQSP